MANNIIYRVGDGGIVLTLAVAEGIVSGNAVEIVDMHGVALTSRDSNGNAQVMIPCLFVADLPVEAVDEQGNSAVAIGDTLFYDSAATIKVNKDATNGKPIGHALETITSGSNGTIQVAIGAGMVVGANPVIQIARAFAKLDLSGSAQADVPILHTSRACIISKAILLYTEASSADAGVAVKIGKEDDDDYYYTGTSEVSKAAWYEKEVTLLQTIVAAGQTVVCSNAGGKTGTGEILVSIEYYIVG